QKQQRNGWPSLGGQKRLEVVKLPLGDLGHSVDMFYKSEVARFLRQHRKATTFPIRVSTGTWIDNRTFRPGTTKSEIRKARIYLVIRGAEEQFPQLPRTCLHKWSTRKEPCRFLADSAGEMRSIDCQLVDPPFARNREQVIVLSKDDLQKIDAGCASTD